MKLSWRSALGLVVSGVILGSVASVAAQTEVPQGETQPLQVQQAQEPGPGPSGPGMRMHGPGGKPMRSEAVFEGENGGAVRTVRMDNGELTAIDGNTLTIREQDGTVVRVTVSDSTRISRDHEQAQLSDLKVGDRVHAVQERTGDGAFTTIHVHAISAEEYAQMEARRQACQSDPSQCPRRGPGGPGGPGRRGPGGPPPAGGQAPAPANA